MRGDRVGAVQVVGVVGETTSGVPADRLPSGEILTVSMTGTVLP
jgi:hypothetical protein